MKRKNLISRLKNIFYSGLVSSSIVFGSLQGCGSPSEPTQNYKPQVTLEASPISGTSPLETRIHYECVDNNGSNDIAKSYVVIGGDTLRTKSLDFNFTFTKSTEIKEGYCEDRQGLIDIKGPISIEIIQPQKDQIAFLGNSMGIQNIYLVNTDGTGLESLTTPGLYSEPTWSPDGKQIAFTNDVNRRGFTSIYVMNADGSNQRNITPDIDIAAQPAWSPDGKQITFAYIDYGLGSGGLGLIGTDGGGFSQLVEKSAGNFISLSPAWSPDGSKIFYHDGKNGNRDIFSIKSDGTGLEKIIDTPYDENSPNISPDGNRFVFVSNRFGNFDIFSANLDGTDIKRITNDFREEIDPEFSSDGDKIVFSRWNSVSVLSWIYLLDLDKMEEERISLEGSNRYPTWRPGQ